MKFYTVTDLSLVLVLMTHAVKTTAFVVSPKGTAPLPLSYTSTTAGSKINSGITRKTNHRNKILFMSSSTTGESEIEKLLRMAKELRAQAEESEKEVQEQQADKKVDRDTRLNGLLNHLFYDGKSGSDSGSGNKSISMNGKSIVVERLRSKKPSRDTLEKFVDWLDDRRDIALGYDYVQAKGDKFVSASGEKNEKEAERLLSLTDELLDALQVIDNEKKRDDGHLGGGNNSANLMKRLKEKRRVRDEQYLERQASFREASTIKKGESNYEYHDEFLDDKD